MKLLIMSIVIAQATAVQFATNRCNKGWTKVGCFHDRVFPDRPLPIELVNRRDPINHNFDGFFINWDDYNTTLHALACTCAETAHALNHEYFGLQFYGECWSGMENPTFNRDGLGKEGYCINGGYNVCNDEDDRECIGDEFTNYIYRVGNIKPIIDGNWGEWGVWSRCSKSCDGGEHVRRRYCNNPRAQNGGKACVGRDHQYEVCNDEPCFGTCEKELEIALALDSSSSVTRRGWNKTLEFVLDLAYSLDISESKIHLGIVKFNNRVHRVFKPSNRKFWNHESVERKIKKMTFEYGSTRIDLAIDSIREDLFCDTCGVRPGVPKVMIVITDGKNSRGGVLQAAAQRAKDAHIEALAVGVGPQVDEDELRMIAKEDHIFKITNYNYIKSYLNKILIMTCSY